MLIKRSKITKISLTLTLILSLGLSQVAFADTQDNTSPSGARKTQIDQNKRALANLNTRVINLQKQIKTIIIDNKKELPETVKPEDFRSLVSSIKDTNDRVYLLELSIKNLSSIIKENKKAIDDLATLIGTNPDPEYNVKLSDNGRAVLLRKSVVEGSGFRIPSAENCGQVGEWFIQNVIVRDWNQFFVEDNGVAKMCELNDDNKWRVKLVSPATLAHVIEVKR